MPKRCTDPRCPLNKSINKLQKDFCKIHGRPGVTFALDDAHKHHRERERRRICSRTNKVRNSQEVTKRDRSNSRCCKNKKCQTFKYTSERSTSTGSRPKPQSHTSGKCEMHFHRYKDKGRPCECRHKRCCKGKEETASDKKKARSGKGIRRYRSRRRKRKRKYSWLRNCLRFCSRFCICAKSSSMIELKECCCTCHNKYGESSKMMQRSRQNIFPATNETWRENNPLVCKCHCMNSIGENRVLPHRDQSYLQGAFSRGLNVMRRGINLCM